MPRKKLDYASMFSYNEKKDIYYTKRGGRQYYSKDPKKLYDRIQALESGEPEAPPTFRQVAEAWKDKKWKEITDNTKYCYGPYYKRLLAELGDEPVESLTAADFQRIILRMKQEQYSAKTVKTLKCVAGMIMTSAITSDPPLIRYNPVASVTIPRGLPKAKRSAPEEDIRKIINENVRTAYFGLFPFLLAYTGCRRGEALALTWGDIDFDEKTVTISKAYAYPNGMPQLKEPKTEAGIRTIPLFPMLQTELRRVCPEKAKPTALIFPMPGNLPMQENAFRRHWLHWSQDVGLVTDDPTEKKGKNGRTYTKHHYRSTVTPHQLRHLFVTLCFEAGVDAETTKEWAGHADIQTTLNIYTDLRRQHETTQRRKMEEYLSKTNNG